MRYHWFFRTLGIALVLLACAGSALAAPADSKRLAQAKDLIADEQWAQAVSVLKQAADDPKETNKDEALFWLAHSQNQAGDRGAALQTILRLERDYRASRWVKPAQSLRIEIAQRLRRNDVLWYTAVPPAPPAPPTTPVPPAPPARPAATPPVPATPAAPPPPPVPPAAVWTAPPPPPAPPAPPRAWIPEDYFPDTDQRILALGGLIATDAPKVVPMLKAIALTDGSLTEARRALFVLAQSGQPLARATVVDVAKTGSEPVRIAAVRELGRFGGPAVSNDLVQVYTVANPKVKFEVVRVMSLFNVRAEQELIQLAKRETDPALRDEILARLRALGTPGAKAYLDSIKQK